MTGFLRLPATTSLLAARVRLRARLSRGIAVLEAIPADDWVLNEISTHVRRFGTGLGEVIVTNRLGNVARRNSFGDCWRKDVADARICGKPPAPAQDRGQLR